ncbi:acyltransferase [Kitasatospora sp. GP82]|uniref:acyltransferase family protein n=1 Tax=Kitasatospora sp. GP82 TaxID=3035089 RepID=UPI002474296C|nr:acyltransferase [Kitasatospora sp. GP82]MDH6124219.1 peptidoglycan/LPS O-acetylase OafA/YrhL [Kitasatospora sp. GP82]
MGWLDALRGVAALLVAVHHFGLLHLLPYGGTINREFDLGIYAVMLFFLVSGYIVPASLERRGDVRGFWIGRIFRIYPLLIVVIAAALLILPRTQSAVPDVVLDHPVRSALANTLLLHEMLNVPSALGAMWTLCYEMVFYFFVGALFVQGRHRWSSPIAIGFAALALLLGAAVTPAMITVDQGSTRNLIAAAAAVMAMGLVCILTGRTALVRLGSLVLGGLGAVLLFLNARSTFFESMMILATMFAGTAIHRIERGRLDRLQGTLCCGFVLVSGVLAGYLYNHGDALYRTWTSGWIGFSLPYAAAWLTFGLGMLLRHRRFPRVLTWLGAISYSVYVVHIPVLHAVRWLIPDGTFPSTGPGRFIPALIFLAAVLLLGHLTYRLVELPGQKLGRRVLKALDRRSAAAAGSPAAAAHNGTT